MASNRSTTQTGARGAFATQSSITRNGYPASGPHASRHRGPQREAGATGAFGHHAKESYEYWRGVISVAGVPNAGTNPFVTASDWTRWVKSPGYDPKWPKTPWLEFRDNGWKRGDPLDDEMEGMYDFMSRWHNKIRHRLIDAGRMTYLNDPNARDYAYGRTGMPSMPGHMDVESYEGTLPDASALSPAALATEMWKFKEMFAIQGGAANYHRPIRTQADWIAYKASGYAENLPAKPWDRYKDVEGFDNVDTFVNGPSRLGVLKNHSMTDDDIRRLAQKNREMFY